MEEKEEHEKKSKTGHAFLVEAAIDERGPQELTIVPSYHQYLVYEDNNMCSCIQLNDDGEWEQIEGQFTNGVVRLIGQAIQKVKNSG